MKEVRKDENITNDERFFEGMRRKARRNQHLPWNKKLERESANVQNGRDYRELAIRFGWINQNP